MSSLTSCALEFLVSSYLESIRRCGLDEERMSLWVGFEVLKDDYYFQDALCFLFEL